MQTVADGIGPALEARSDVEAGLEVGLGELAAERADWTADATAQLALYFNNRVGRGSQAVKGLHMRQCSLLCAHNSLFLELDDSVNQAFLLEK
ncbi:hypothetical protein [Tsukamurella soli]|uniref:Uncharacterized protein n=1 Tax=Tsukamurella soli TaxID=644556 RepID=A0ABP8J1P6_9ACTN